VTEPQGHDLPDSLGAEAPVEAYLDEPMTHTSEIERVEEVDADDEDADLHADEPSARPAKRKGRASVPSWDEIMFGGGKHD
jgi:hypothetical protein